MNPRIAVREILTAQVGRNVKSGMASASAGIILTVVSYPVYLHYLGYRSLGLWVILTTVLTVIQLSNLGVDGAVMTIVARELGAQSPSRAAAVVSTATGILLAGGILASMALTCWPGLVSSSFGLTAEEALAVARILPLVGGLSALAMAVRVAEAAASAMGRMDLTNFSRIVARVLGFGVSVLLLAGGWGLLSMLAGTAVTFSVQYIACLIVARRVLPLGTFLVPKITCGCARELVAIGSGLAAASALGALLSPIIRLVLARYASVEALPIYEMAYSGSMNLRSIVEMGLRALVPEIGLAKGSGWGGSRNARRLVAEAEAAVIWVALPAWTLFALAAPVVLPLWLGANFHPELVSTFRVMLLASWLSLLAVPGYYCLVGLGRTSPLVIAQAVSSAVTSAIVLGLPLVAGAVTVTDTAFAVAAGSGTLCVILVLQWRKSIDGEDVQARPNDQ